MTSFGESFFSLLSSIHPEIRFSCHRRPKFELTHIMLARASFALKFIHFFLSLRCCRYLDDLCFCRFFFPCCSLYRLDFVVFRFDKSYATSQLLRVLRECQNIHSTHTAYVRRHHRGSPEIFRRQMQTLEMRRKTIEINPFCLAKRQMDVVDYVGAESIDFIFVQLRFSIIICILVWLNLFPRRGYVNPFHEKFHSLLLFIVNRGE